MGINGFLYFQRILEVTLEVFLLKQLLSVEVVIADFRAPLPV